MTTRQTTSPFALTRRAFVLSASAAATLGIRAADGEKPLLRIGAMSDDHLHAERPKTHQRTKACFDLFRREQVDVVVDTGDIADLSDVGELKRFRRFFDDAFAGTACVPFFCIANHDYNYVPGTKRNDPKNIENAWRALGMSCANPTAVVKGYQFVNVFQDESRPNAFADAVAKAVAANTGDRPVFVVNHVPPFLTTTGTVHWSSRAIREVLNKYPQVVALTGHIHRSISWAANVWQGEFTAVNLGAHAEYSNRIDGEAVILDVFADRIDIRRYEAMSGREIGADDRWSIPLPLDPAHGPYRTDRRAKACPVPVIPADAKATYWQHPSGHKGTLTFPSASPRNAAAHYRLDVESQGADGAWQKIAQLNWSTPQVFAEPDTWTTAALLPAQLDAGRPHRVTITPVNCFDIPGPSRTLPFDVPANPMEKLPVELAHVERYQHGQRPGQDIFTPGADGWFDRNDKMVLVVLPKALTAATLAKKTVTLVFDIASDQPAEPNTFSIGRFTAGGGKVELGLGDRIYTLPGKTPSLRYAWTIRKGANPSPDDEYCLAIREGGAARFKISGVKCFVR